MIDSSDEFKKEINRICSEAIDMAYNEGYKQGIEDEDGKLPPAHRALAGVCALCERLGHKENCEQCKVFTLFKEFSEIDNNLMKILEACK